ncbi:EAL domain-containing response regulator [Gloeothece verrucosa]|uniref:Response regulator receiver modulated diguanylate cyclase/phosphodiesterase n=1 Tax=Gloeothece verrucosa (strain PCC 7822) TaxID=497965 RepID=E0U6T8_GLOV7|nr:EAL domain-containing response regulator [Gloeothece verrucosa]ADN15975.1 response regulator receiver modulated diguanylate cyclase/phosphodiesterase [Gloeothece verrucosa PCC 7822]
MVNLIKFKGSINIKYNYLIEETAVTTILVIEDDEIIRDIINDILSLVGFDVIEATNGQQGLEIALSTYPDLIICDIMMPQLDGYGVLQALQCHSTTESIPFIFLTAKGTPVNIREGMDLGADDYLTKPFSEEGLLKAVTTRLKKRASIELQYINKIQEIQNKLEFLLHHDPLTNLPNQLLLRKFFQEFISKQKSSQTAKDTQTPDNKNQSFIPILSIGLDRFERIHESFGYEISDILLKLVAQRLVSCVHKQGIIARLSEDEFVIILNPVVDKHFASQIAEHIINTFSHPFMIESQEVFITLSLGIVIYPRDSQKLQELIQKSKAIMKRVKQMGGNSYEFYSRLIEKNVVSDYLDLETDLRHALERNEFEVYYQPKVSCETGKIVGAEALCRWNNPKRGMVSPGIFVPIAEEIGLIEPLGEWVLRTACKQAKDWQKKGLNPIKIAVNISARQFNQKNLALWLSNILEEINFNGQLLELELTESMLLENPSISVLKLRGLKTLGVKIAIDDFGTGYSSLSYLQQFPFDILKIDRCFVKNIDQNVKNAEITKALISLAHHLNLVVVAEGVETKPELSFLKTYNCDEIQGFLFSRPLPASEFERLATGELNFMNLT